MLVELQPEFEEVLQSLGQHAIEFFLAASLYHAGKISFNCCELPLGMGTK